MRLIIHLGQPKTGTTAIQTVLMNSRQVLQEQGVIYPDFGEFPANVSPAMLHPLSHFACVPMLLLNPAWLGFTAEDVAFSRSSFTAAYQQAKAVGNAEVMILSHEVLATQQRNLSLDWLLSNHTFDSIETFTYFRRGDTWLESYYAQSIKEGFRVPGGVKQHFYFPRRYQFFPFETSRSLSRLRGLSASKTLSFDKRAKAGNLEDSFLQDWGLAGLKGLVREHEAVNESLPADVVDFLQRFLETEVDPTTFLRVRDSLIWSTVNNSLRLNVNGKRKSVFDPGTRSMLIREWLGDMFISDMPDEDKAFYASTVPMIELGKFEFVGNDPDFTEIFDVLAASVGSDVLNVVLDKMRAYVRKPVVVGGISPE
jgi:hypothetical protein